MTVYLLGTIAVLALTPTFVVAGLLVLHLCKCGWLSFWETIPEEPMQQLPEVDYCGCKTKPLVRIAELKFQFRDCGHRTCQWDSDRGVCLQCVLEGRVAASDRGRLQ